MAPTQFPDPSDMPMPQNGVIVMAAPNGATRTKRDHPNLPITPSEIAVEAKRCLAAGAAVFHLHVRDENGGHSLETRHYELALEAVHNAVGDRMIVQVTTEAGGRYRPAAQMEVARTLKPEAVSIAVREFVQTEDDMAGFADFLDDIKSDAIWPQFILYEPEDLVVLATLREQGRLPFNVPYLLFVLGRYTPGQVSDPSALDPYRVALDAFGQARWSMCAFGRNETSCVKQALDMGGDVRVGFENNLMLPDGALAKSSSELVSLAAESALAKGRPKINAAQVRQNIPKWC